MTSVIINGATGTVLQTTASNTALVIGPNGVTNPSLVVDTSTTSAATGFSVKSKAVGNGIALAAISSGTNENLTLDSAGSGTITLNATGTGNILTPRQILANGASSAIGYGTGAGSTVTQLTNKSTGVTLNNPTGTITMNNANLAATTSVAFTLTNSMIAATDVVVVNFKSGNTANSYFVSVDAVGAGSCSISLRNYTAGGLAEAVVLSFAVIKGVAA